MNNCSNGHVPGGVSSHAKAKERPNPVVVKWGYEDGCSTASSENVCPRSLIQSIVDVVDVTVLIYMRAYIYIYIVSQREEQ